MLAFGKPSLSRLNRRLDRFDTAVGDTCCVMGIAKPHKMRPTPSELTISSSYDHYADVSIEPITAHNPRVGLDASGHCIIFTVDIESWSSHQYGDSSYARYSNSALNAFADYRSSPSHNKKQKQDIHASRRLNNQRSGRKENIDSGGTVPNVDGIESSNIKTANPPGGRLLRPIIRVHCVNDSSRSRTYLI
jgi:hypothetical protein